MNLHHQLSSDEVASQCPPAATVRFKYSSALKQDWRVLSVLGHRKHSPENAAQKQGKQNEKGTIQTTMSKALNQLVLDSFLSITAMWLLKQKECIELVQVENWLFD